MLTVIIPTTDRPEMLRTALGSLEKQTAKDKISRVIVSENAGNRGSAQVSSEFPSLPIEYFFREPLLSPVEHGCALLDEASRKPTKFLAYLHDDDWWGINHVATGLYELGRNPDAVAYWATSFLVHGESSWFLQCWNESCWVASGFKPMTEVAKLDCKQAAIACVTSGPAHYSSFIGHMNCAVESLREVSKGKNLHDSDRLFFLALAKRGPLLVNFVPEVFVRQHPRQDQRSLTHEESSEHVSAATREIIDFCKAQNFDVLHEFEVLYEQCPVPSYRPYLVGTMDPRVMDELDRLELLPLARLVKPPPQAEPLPPPPPAERPRPNVLKRIARQLSPPLLWKFASVLKHLLTFKPSSSDEVVVPGAGA